MVGRAVCCTWVLSCSVFVLTVWLACINFLEQISRNKLSGTIPGESKLPCTFVWLLRVENGVASHTGWAHVISLVFSDFYIVGGMAKLENFEGKWRPPFDVPTHFHCVSFSRLFLTFLFLGTGIALLYKLITTNSPARSHRSLVIARVSSVLVCTPYRSLANEAIPVLTQIFFVNDYSSRHLQ